MLSIARNFFFALRKQSNYLGENCCNMFGALDWTDPAQKASPPRAPCGANNNLAETAKGI